MASLPLSEFTLVGLSFRTAPVDVREKLAIPAAELAAFAAAVKAGPGVEELMLVSTCNRVEAYVYGGPDAAAAVRSAFVARAGQKALASLYERRGPEAITHLFRVACSLDSMVLGEPQILGQVKDAYAAAQQVASIGSALEQAAQAAFAAAKRVRTETAIGSSAVSMASAAVELARKIFGSLAGRTVLLVGAGKMSELSAKHLASDKSRVLVTNRTFQRGAELADKVGGKAYPWDQLHNLLVEADIVVSSTAAPMPVLTVPMLQAVLKQRHYRPLFLVDLAVPRDIEEGVGRLENVYAYNVDDLAQVVEEGRSSRETEARRAEGIVRDEVDRFFKVRQLRDALPVLAQLRNRGEEIARLEAERTLALFEDGSITPKQRKSIEAMARAVVNKLLHEPTMRLREAGKAGPDEAAAMAVVVAQLFGLEVPARPNGVHGGNGAGKNHALEVPAERKQLAAGDELELVEAPPRRGGPLEQA